MKPFSFETFITHVPHLPKTRCLEIPEKIIRKIGKGFNARLNCAVNDAEFRSGLMALGEGKGYICVNAKWMKQAGVKEGDKVVVHLREDTSAFGVDIPEELEILLAQDDEGKRRFLLLTPGKQRYIINYIAAVKNPQSRIDRAIRLIENVKRLPEGKETPKGIFGVE
ncbi:MAG: hypothetical protein Fur0041_02000 [Bacteroidia bacterium]